MALFMAPLGKDGGRGNMWCRFVIISSIVTVVIGLYYKSVFQAFVSWLSVPVASHSSLWFQLMGPAGCLICKLASGAVHPREKSVDTCRQGG